jgi:hypothetical protein
MFHLSPRFWLDDQLLTLVEPEAFELQPDPDPSDLLLVPAVDTDVLGYDVPRNAAPAPPVTVDRIAASSSLSTTPTTMAARSAHSRTPPRTPSRAQRPLRGA